MLWDISTTVELLQDLATDVKVVFDKGSWRKERTDIYKQNREEKKKTIDYSGFDEVREVIENFLNDLNIQTFSIYSAEGDDLIKLLINATDADILIWSADSDLIQMLETGERKVIQYSPLKKNLYVTDSFLKNIKTFTFDDVINESEDLKYASKIDPILTKCTSSIKNPTFVLLDKIIRGDKSDGIKSIQKGVGEKKVQSIYRSLNDEFNFSLDKIDFDFILSDDLPYTLINEIQQIVKIKNDNIVEDIIENRELITLHEKFIPEVIVEEFKSFDISKNLTDIKYLTKFDDLVNDCEYIYNNTRTIHFPMFGMD